MSISKSRILFREARQYLPGGVNSPVRAFKAVGRDPIYIKSARGSKVYDVDGNQYIDYICSWGALILGHAHPLIVKAIKTAAQKGTSYGINYADEVKLARMIISAFPSMEKVRLVNSGTEAVMTAIRLARAFTRRDKIIKFDGCYHGHSDGLLVKAGSGAATFGIPNSAGVSKDVVRDTIPLPYNDLTAIKRLLARQGKTIAAVIVEPVAANMGVVPPLPGFLETLRRLTRQYGVLLIFDEVITGFRIAYGGAQTHYGIRPDLTTLGKIIGGGTPVGAFGGRKEIMNLLTPQGNVYQAGTFSANPITVAAGLAALTILFKNRRSLYKELETKAAKLDEGLKAGARKRGVDIRINRAGSMLTMFFTGRRVYDYQSVMSADTKRFARYFRNMLKAGVNLPPSQFEASFVSRAHSGQDIERKIRAHAQSLDFK